MSSKKEQLFRVIESLKPNEKAYFRKFTYKVAHDESLVFQLFELIEKAQKKGIVDEQKLNKAFLKINPKADYIKVKSRLLQKIFDAITSYDRNSNTNHVLYELLELAESLYNRKLIQDALLTLKKAEKIALQNQELELLLKIKEQYISMDAYFRVFNREDINQSFYTEPLHYIKLLHNKMLVRDVTHQVHHFQKLIGSPRSPEDLQIMKSLEAAPGLQISFDVLDESAKMDQTLSLCILNFTKGEFQEVIHVCNRFIAQYKHSINAPKLLHSKLIAIYDSLMQACLMSKNFDAFNSIFNQFESLALPHDEHIHLKNGVSLYVNAVAGIYLNKLELYEEFDKQFMQLTNDGLLPNYRIVSTAYYLILGLFIAEKFELASSRISWLLQQQNLSIRYDIDVAIRVMNLIILLEKDEWFHLEYAIRNFQHLLEHRERKFELELLFMKLLKKSLKLQSPQLMMNMLIDIKTKIEHTIQQQPIEANFLMGFDIITWIESKLQKRPFKDVFFEKENLV